LISAFFLWAILVEAVTVFRAFKGCLTVLWTIYGTVLCGHNHWSQ
jgi:hypothetical protein